MLIGVVYGMHEETAVDRLRAKYDVKADEHVILLTSADRRYEKLLLALSDDEIDKIAGNGSKLLVICSQGNDCVRDRVRVKCHPISKEIEELPELFAEIADKTVLNEKIRRLTPLTCSEKNLSGPFKIRQNEKDRIRLVQVLTFTFAKHHDMCYIVAHEKK